MQWVFIAATVLGVLYFGFAKRHFDLFTAAFGGCFIYFSPGFFGHAKYLVDGVWPEVAISDRTYAVMILVTMAVVVSAMATDALARSTVGTHARRPPMSQDSVPELALLALASIAGLFAMIATTGAAVFDPDKQVMLEGLNRWQIVFEVCAQVGFCLAAMTRRLAWLALFAALLLFDVYIGLRVGLAMALGAMLLALLHAHGPMRILVERKRTVLMLLLGIAFIMVLKGYIGHIKAGSWDYIIANRLDFESILLPITQNESFVVISTLNEILVQNLRWDIDAYFARAGAATVPLGYHLVEGVPPFEFQDRLFPRVNYGMASTPWGQAWAVGGWFFLSLVVALFCGVIAFANRFVFRLRAPVQAALLVALAFWCLYIHRNTMEFQVVSERRYILVAILLVLFRGAQLELRRMWGKVGPTVKHD